MMKETRITTIGGADVTHAAQFTDEELRMAFGYLYRLQSLRYDRDTSLKGMACYTITPSANDESVWEFVSLNEDVPVCITPEFELPQMISMARTAMTVTETIKNLRMAHVAI